MDKREDDGIWMHNRKRIGPVLGLGLFLSAERWIHYVVMLIEAQIIYPVQQGNNLFGCPL